MMQHNRINQPIDQSRFSAILQQHEDLLRQSSETSDVDLDISQVQEFLNILAQAGTNIGDTERRSMLRALIRYWASVVNDYTEKFPIIQLQPFERSIAIYDSQEPSEEGKQLVTLFNDMESKQLDFLDKSGKSLIERIATFLVVLFGVTAFGSNFPPAYLKGNLPAKVLVIIALILYLAAMGAGLWAIQPLYYRHYTYNVSRLGKELEKITKHKMFWLRIAGILFTLGSVALAVLIVSIIWNV